MNKKTVLVVMDGVGTNAKEYGNAVISAYTPTLDMLKATCPYTDIKAHGTAEDKAWFVSLLENTPKVKKTNNLTKQEYETDDMKTIRNKVIDKYFPHLKKKKKGEPKLSYEEQVRKELGL